MTVPTMNTTTTRRPPRWPAPLHYAVHSTWLTVKNFAFVVFAVGMPLVLYIVFSQTFSGSGPDAGLVSAMIMVSMAAYGALGAAMSGGAQLATERRSGWFRQLSVTTLAPREFLLAKAGVIMVLVLPVAAAGVRCRLPDRRRTAARAASGWRRWR